MFWLRVSALSCIAVGGCAVGDQPDQNTFGPGLGGNSGNSGNSGNGTGPGDGDDGDDGDDGGPTDGPAVTDGGPGDGTADSGGPTTNGDAETGEQGCVTDVDCNDGDACTTDVCDDLGSCQHPAVDCSDGVDCTTDTCDSSSGCANIPDPTPCDNGNACDGVETCDATLGCQAGVAINCDDGQACTMDTCNPADGTCSSAPLAACNAGDGCCPLGCSANVDTDCVCTNNAPSATPSASAGGNNGTGYGPSNYNDGVSEAGCQAASCFQCYGWVDNDTVAGGDFMQLTWPAEQTIGSMLIETSNVGSGLCTSTLNRNIEDGTVQYWNGASWVNAQTFTNQNTDLSFNFDPPLQTTQVRIFDLTATAPGDNSLVFEWYVYEPLDCG